MQIGVAMRKVLDKEFPHNWPGLMEKIMGYVGAPDSKYLYGALCALLIVTKKYSYSHLSIAET